MGLNGKRSIVRLAILLLLALALCNFTDRATLKFLKRIHAVVNPANTSVSRWHYGVDREGIPFLDYDSVPGGFRLRYRDPQRVCAKALDYYMGISKISINRHSLLV